jgi:WD40 repeat protein
LFDTSTYVAVKSFHATSWVTSISWEPTLSCNNHGRDLVAVRTDNTCISVLDLSPTRVTNTHLASCQGNESSVSWSKDGTLIARAFGTTIIIADTLENYRDGLTFHMTGEVTQVSFCHAPRKEKLLAAVDDSGSIVIICVQFDQKCALAAEEVKFGTAAPYLKALAWSTDGSILATGGRDKFLYVYDSLNLQAKVEPVKLEGRIWDIDFVPENLSHVSGYKLLLGVALGDYSTIILNENFEPVLQVSRSRTCRCLSFNPTQNLMAVGDGAGFVTIVDYSDEELVTEIDVKGRVNVVKYSPAGDFLVVGTDSSRFSILESGGYRCLQEISKKGFAQSASFSPAGMHLALGSVNEAYSILRLGPFLAIDLVPLTLDGGIEQIPDWALKEALFRSWDGPSFIQRHMIKGGPENLQRVATILRNHPNSVYTFDRRTNVGSFTTALNQKIPNLLKLALMTLVDGTLAPNNDEEKNFLTTMIPFQGREILADIVKNYPAEFAVDIFNAITFMKVPFACPKIVENGSRLEIGSDSYKDPWLERSHSGRYLEKSTPSMELGRKNREYISRAPAVLPLPGLGDMDFLASLLMFAPLEVFENEAMAVVVRVVWYNHIRKFFFLDCVIFALYYTSWVALVELTFSNEDSYEFNEDSTASWMASLTIFLNTLFAIKEMMQSRLGNREIYWRSLWNTIDISSIVCVYIYALNVLLPGFIPSAKVPLAVITTLLLTAKVLAYLRGFGDTGWLISVLIANFRDVRGFLIILFVILVGFSVSFRALFGDSDDDAFGSLRRSLLSTFQLTLTSEYDATTISDAENQVLAVATFVLAVTVVLVVALNALISILADSYARVQQNAVANRRKEVAALIVEYMSLLTPRKRNEIEHKTKWFHKLLEVDADGSLQIQKDDWEGGLNALRNDIKDMTESNRDATQKAISEMKEEFDSELSRFKKDVLSILEGMNDDVKYLRRAQAKGIKLDGRNVVKAVQVVQAVGQKVGQQGGALLKIAEGQAVNSMGRYRSKSISAFTRS